MPAHTKDVLHSAQSLLGYKLREDHSHCFEQHANSSLIRQHREQHPQHHVKREWCDEIHNTAITQVSTPALQQITTDNIVLILALHFVHVIRVARLAVVDILT